MRLDSEFKKAGYFFVPSNPDKKLPGTLTVVDGGDIELEVTTDETGLADLNEYNIGRIIGILEKEGLVTLDGCFYRSRKFSFGAPATSSIRVGSAFVGAKYDADEEVVFSEFRFSVEGIDDWLRTSGIQVEYTEKTASITYIPQPPIKVYSDGDCEVLIKFKYTLPGHPNFTEARITQSAYFSISTEQSKDLSFFTSRAFKITNFLCFATNCSLSMHNASAVVPSASSENGKPFNVKVFYPSLPFSESKPNIKQHDMRFTYPHISDRVQCILENWFDAYNNLAPALNLYFSTQNGTHKYLDTKFLSLAQGLETFSRRTHSDTQMQLEHFQALAITLLVACPKEKHDWLWGRIQHGNEVTQAARLKKLIEPFKSLLGTSKSVKTIIRKSVATRNYLTHYDISGEKEAATGRNLWILVQKLEVVFELNLLKLLSFSDEQIVSICSFGNLEQKLSLILE